jgi:hypothetical protein
MFSFQDRHKSATSMGPCLDADQWPSKIFGYGSDQEK